MTSIQGTSVGRLTGIALTLGAMSLLSPVPEHRAEAETVQSCRRKGCKLNINTYRCICPRRRPRITAAQRCRRKGCVYQRRRRKCVCRSRPVARRVSPRRPAVLPAGRRNRRTGIHWVTISGGTFLMGAKHSRMTRPVRRVAIPTFELARSEITVAQYRRCVQARICQKPVRASRCTWTLRNNDHMPMNCVTWHEARIYAKWAGARLPSEAEWEYAARSRGKNHKYPWGDTRPNCKLVTMNQKRCRIKHPQTVCQSPAGNTEQGLCDMAGNVWEWTMDTYHGNYRNAPTDGSAWITSSKYNRIIRGGDLVNMASNIRTRYRYYHSATGYRNGIGFRVARAKP